MNKKIIGVLVFVASLFPCIAFAITPLMDVTQGEVQYVVYVDMNDECIDIDTSGQIGNYFYHSSGIQTYKRSYCYGVFYNQPPGFRTMNPHETNGQTSPHNITGEVIRQDYDDSGLVTFVEINTSNDELIAYGDIDRGTTYNHWDVGAGPVFDPFYAEGSPDLMGVCNSQTGWCFPQTDAPALPDPGAAPPDAPEDEEFTGDTVPDDSNMIYCCENHYVYLFSSDPLLYMCGEVDFTMSPCTGDYYTAGVYDDAGVFIGNYCVENKCLGTGDCICGTGADGSDGWDSEDVVNTIVQNDLTQQDNLQLLGDSISNLQNHVDLVKVATDQVNHSVQGLTNDINQVNNTTWEVHNELVEIKDGINLLVAADSGMGDLTEETPDQSTITGGLDDTSAIDAETLAAENRMDAIVDGGGAFPVDEPFSGLIDSVIPSESAPQPFCIEVAGHSFCLDTAFADNFKMVFGWLLYMWTLSTIFDLVVTPPGKA